MEGNRLNLVNSGLQDKKKQLKTYFELIELPKDKLIDSSPVIFLKLL